MVNLRCSKCGSDSGFLIATQERKVIEVKGRLPTDRILKTVQVTCMYCNNHWDHVPITITDKALEQAVEKRLVH